MNTPSVDTKTQSAIIRLCPGGAIEKVSTQPTQIQFHSTALWETLTERETAVIYKQALGKTWMLLKHAIALLVLLTLFAIALIFSIWAIGFTVGAALGQDPDKMQQELLTRLQSLLQYLVELANNYIRAYLPWWQSSDTQQ